MLNGSLITCTCTYVKLHVVHTCTLCVCMYVKLHVCMSCMYVCVCTCTGTGSTHSAKKVLRMYFYSSTSTVRAVMLYVMSFFASLPLFFFHHDIFYEPLFVVVLLFQSIFRVRAKKSRTQHICMQHDKSTSCRIPT